MQKNKEIQNKILLFFKTLISSDENKTGLRKFFNSLWAILFGLIISSIFMMAINKNPFLAFQSIIKGGNNLKEITWIYFGVYAFGAMSIALSFKCGLFNIGVPGQMMAAGSVSTYIILFSKNTSTKMLLGLLLLSFVVGFIFAAFSGILKSYFNVHEVVSTILMNWIIFYLFKYIYRIGTKYNNNGESESQYFDISHSLLNVNTYGWIFVIIMAIGVGLLLLFIISKTTIGFKIKASGLNQNASKYSGYNEKLITILTLGMSGGLAGISGFIFYILKTNNVSFHSGQPLSYGFDVIAIALLAYNNFIGVLLSSIFYAYLQSGQSQLEFDWNIGREFYAIIIGIIIYFAAISIVFNKFNLISKSYHIIIRNRNYEYKKQKQNILQKYKKNKLIIKKDLKKSKNKNKKEIINIISFLFF